MARLALTALALCLATASALAPLRSNTAAAGFSQIGSFKASNPAFFTVAPFQLVGETPSDSLFISSFTGSPFSSGAIYVVENITSWFGHFDSITPVSLNLSFAWPNAIAPIPANVLQQLQLTNGILVPDGFLVPGKNNGGLYVVTQPSSGAQPVKYQINDASADKGFFYHTALWVDMNADGRLDLLSAHANKPLFGSTQTGLVWFEQPDDGLNTLPWKMNKITDGPDVFFTLLELDGNSDTIELVATEFFTKQLSLNIISVTAQQAGALLLRRIIDAQIGAAYHVDVVLLSGGNNSSASELLVTNHQDESSNGVYAYSIPSDIKTGDFVKRTLASGFPVTEGGMNQAAPGFAYAVDPHHPSTSDAPHILVAGDGSQSAYLMTPDTNSPPQYTLQTVIDTKGTVGSLFVTEDWNNDGLREFLVPDYDHGQIYVYSFTDSQ